MANIETGKELKMENVLSLRKKMTQGDIQQEMMKIGKFFEENGIKKNGPVVTATFAVEEVNGQQLLDMEILVPMDREVQLTGEYVLKKEFHLVNAVYARHQGNPNLLQSTYNEVMKYINENRLHQITMGYNVNVNEPQTIEEMDGMIVDIYIGVNPSIL
ncbi:GyrI-like domain-containing protein [Alkaliphilus hydrothermalis]|uniref:Effector-binding domain-containing protein n=1 Tax=Alkaliphilus hydrothermalis TaxID=1482730 RepID=A0ABS2NQ17_9FIRM|nr:GyrI-like domain-containing protein [Alkaliphilus hydrothermalis]MBM7615037.1 effector-binding domain-containing protein [Alkaliphilus hydrothermalis]